MNTITTVETSSAVSRALSTPKPLSAEIVRALYGAGYELFERGEFRYAADIFRFIVLADGTLGEAWWALAGCHDRLEDYRVAATLYALAFRLKPCIELGLLLTTARINAGQPDAARERLAEVRELALSTDDLTRLAEIERFLQVAA